MIPPWGGIQPGRIRVRRFIHILVTSNYHVPRSLLELGRSMPEAHVTPYGVVTAPAAHEAWSRKATAARVLLSEYVKFLPAAARLAIARGMNPWQATSVTASSGTPPKS